MPVDLWPVMQHRMATYRPKQGKWWRGVPDEVIEVLLAEIADRGASTARELEHTIERRPAAQGPLGLELVRGAQGAGLPLHGRRRRDRRAHQPVRGALRPARSGSSPPRCWPGRRRRLEEAERELVRRAAASHGVATLKCLADYYRTTQAPVKTAVEQLVEEGELVPVRVEGWNKQAYLHRDAALPRKVEARALLSPFDPVVWERERTERLFDFFYRIEIYTPAGEAGARLLRAAVPAARRDRRPGRPQGRPAERHARWCKSAWAEDGAPEDTAAELREELEVLAAWLGLDSSGSSRRATWRRSSVPEQPLDERRRPSSRRAWHAPRRRAGRPPRGAARRRAAPRSRHGSSPATDLRPIVRPAPARLDRLADVGLVGHRVHRDDEQRQVVGERQHRRGVAAVPDHDRHLGHHLAVGEPGVQLDVGRHPQPARRPPRARWWR